MPSVTVVVPARDRADRLRALLHSLGDADVVVALDRPTDAVERVCADARARVVRAQAPGPAAARNAGWRAAAGGLIAFTDDDCVAAPGWLEALERAAAGAPGALVQGRVEPHPDEEDRIGPFARTLRVRDAGPFFQTANVLYPRAVLERLGGFDEAYAFPAGEDTDLGWRAKEAGVGAVFAADALVWHAVHEPGWRGLVRDARRWGSAVRLVARHPGLREHFHHRIFWKPAHERLLLAAAGLALARRTRGVSLAAAVPYALVHRTEHPDAASLARSLPAHLAVDSAEVAAMARGSVEARSLLL
jgi:GT2 family glycosyltransferase